MSMRLYEQGHSERPRDPRFREERGTGMRWSERLHAARGVYTMPTRIA